MRLFLRSAVFILFSFTTRSSGRTPPGFVCTETVPERTM